MYEQIIEDLTYAKESYKREVERLNKTITQDRDHISRVEERIAEEEKNLARAQAFLDQFDSAIAKLREE